MSVLPEIPSWGKYVVLGTGKWCAIAWRDAAQEKPLVHFLSPASAYRIARDLNFVHFDPSTGEVHRNWSSLKIAWDVKEESSILAVTA